MYVHYHYVYLHGIKLYWNKIYTNTSDEAEESCSRSLVWLKNCAFFIHIVSIETIDRTNTADSILSLALFLSFNPVGNEMQAEVNEIIQ